MAVAAGVEGRDLGCYVYCMSMFLRNGFGSVRWFEAIRLLACICTQVTASTSIGYGRQAKESGKVKWKRFLKTGRPWQIESCPANPERS